MGKRRKSTATGCDHRLFHCSQIVPYAKLFKEALKDKVVPVLN
jgi:hypothetical protein